MEKTNLLFISVTNKHIEDSLENEGDAILCPIARAVTDSLNRKIEHETIVVSGDTVLIVDDSPIGELSCKEYDLPPEIVLWIKDFDAMKVVYPISFELDLTKEIL